MGMIIMKGQVKCKNKSEMLLRFSYWNFVIILVIAFLTL